MHRKDFLKVSAVSFCALALSSGGCSTMKKEKDILEDHYQGTEDALGLHFPQNQAAGLV